MCCLTVHKDGGSLSFVPERLWDAVQAGAGPDLSGDAEDEEDGTRPRPVAPYPPNGGPSDTAVEPVTSHHCPQNHL